jgi:hypothetical protein
MLGLAILTERKHRGMLQQPELIRRGICTLISKTLHVLPDLPIRLQAKFAHN